MQLSDWNLSLLNELPELTATPPDMPLRPPWVKLVSAVPCVWVTRRGRLGSIRNYEKNILKIPENSEISKMHEHMSKL